MDRGGALVGLVLAAGAGRRMGAPKALLRGPDGTSWVVGTLRALRQAGITDLVVVVGAAADSVRTELRDEDVDLVAAEDWAEGMGASLRAGLRHLSRRRDVTAALVVLVDTPGLDAAVVARLAALASTPQALARATYDGLPGHPVLLGAAHFMAVLADAGGDQGAREYLSRHHAQEVECADLASGADVDTPDDLPPGHRLG